MKATTLFTALVLACGTAPALAQHQHGTASAGATATTDGEIRKIDPAKGTALIKHGDMKALGMGPMTMSFKFKDPKMAAGLKDGDKIRFTATTQGDDLIVTEVKKMP
ncbi:MAG: copper-binding protein [Betaproteobacteria bacterium]|jgi:Cu/Ag efflux protein CusF